VALPLAKFPVIVGPTAGGKSVLAVMVAHALARREARDRVGPVAEIVTADAFQVYRGMDIGTAKPTLAEREGIPHHLLDIREPGERFTVADWLAAAEECITDIRARGRTPIVVGGTHLYIKSFLEGMFEGPAEDSGLREELRALPPAALRGELERVDPASAAKLHPNDLRRTVRALEVFRLTGTPISQLQRQWDQEHSSRGDCVLVGLEWPAEEIARRVNSRVRAMVDAGLVDEVRGLWQAGKLRGQAAEGVGYKQLIEAFEGRSSLEDALEQVKIATRHLAKAQRTWLRRLRPTSGSLWLSLPETPLNGCVERVLSACGELPN
jgi:tRNA dimethylallyltransferase